MAQVVNTNIASLNAQRNLVGSQNTLEKTLQRLSTGLRINSAKDDAAGLAISERMTSQIRGLNQATRNANDGVSLAQTAESALATSGDILQRMRELAVQSANATNTASDSESLQDEMNALTSELDRISLETSFNGHKLFDGTFNSQKFQVGANSHQTISITTSSMRTYSYGNNYSVSSGLAATAVDTTTSIVGGIGANGGVSGYVNILGYRGATTAASVNTTSGVVHGTSGLFIGTNQTALKTAADINKLSSYTGVSATARTEVKLEFDEAGAYTMQIVSDNAPVVTNSPAPEAVSVTFNLSATQGTALDLNNVVTAINAQTGKTGVTAAVSEDGSYVLLENASGNDIILGTTNAENIGNIDVTKMYRNGFGELQTGGGDTQILESGAGTPQWTNVSGYVQLDSAFGFQVNTDAEREGDPATFVINGDVAASSLNTVGELSITSFESSTQAIKTIDAAITKVATQRSNLGAFQSRFEYVMSNNTTASENLSAARSRIQDADFASETATLTKAQILQQAGISILAQANQIPQNVLSLLR